MPSLARWSIITISTQFQSPVLEGCKSITNIESGRLLTIQMLYLIKEMRSSDNDHGERIVGEGRWKIHKWLSQLSQSQVKDIFTIKNSDHLCYFQKMISLRVDGKQYTTKAISEGAFAFYADKEMPFFRDKFQYKYYTGAEKHKNKNVENASRSLYDHLTISRLSPHYASVRSSFLVELEDCMDEISKKSIMLFSFLEGKKNTLCLWFEPKTQLHSLAQWVVYMLEDEVKRAYLDHQTQQQQSKGKNKLSLATIYEYVKQQYASMERIRILIERVILTHFMEEEDPKSENFRNRKNFLLQKCIERLEEEHDKHEYLLEYSWFYENKTNINFQIFGKVAEVLQEQYNEWKANKPFEDWTEQQEREKMKKINKRKRRKQRKDNKKGEQNNQQSEGDAIENKSIHVSQEEARMIREEVMKHESIIINKIESISSKVKPHQQKQQEQEETSPIKQPVKLVKKQKQSDTKPKTKQAQVKKQPSGISINNKKIIRDRINEYYESYAEELAQVSSIYDKYRTAVYECLKQFFRHDIFDEGDQTGIDNHEMREWKLEVYGSAIAGFSLRHSDVDLVLLADPVRITLAGILLKLRLKEWAIDAKLIPAQIPLITLKINLMFSQTAHLSLSSKQLKKVESELFSVDLTLAPIGEVHSGIENTKQLKELSITFPIIRNICLFLKQLLRVRGLNKPYTGGVSSYVLILMVHAILGRKNLLEPKKTEGGDMYRMIKQVALYMQNQFKPFRTVISLQKKPDLKPDPSLHLNIQNPNTEQLLKTSAFKIQQVVVELKRLREFQEEVEHRLQNLNINEKRNMKNYFNQQLGMFMSEQLHLEHEHD